MIIHWNLEVCPISGCQISWTHLLSQTRRCWHCMGLHQSSNPQVLSAMTLAGLGEALAKSLDAILQGCPQRRPWFSSWLPVRAAKDRAGHGKKCQSTTSAAWTGKSTWRILKPWCFAPESWPDQLGSVEFLIEVANSDAKVARPFICGGAEYAEHNQERRLKTVHDLYYLYWIEHL